MPDPMSYHADAVADLAAPYVTIIKRMEAERDHLRSLVTRLLRFIPIEKPEQGPLPHWIVEVRDEARAAVGLDSAFTKAKP